jgi:hypothetical protein
MAYPTDKETIKTDWTTSDAPGYTWGNTIGRLLNEIQDLLGITGTPVAGSFTYHKSTAHQVDTASTDTTKDKHVSNALAKGWEDHKALTSGNPHSVTKTDVGLSNVTNDAQMKKIISSTTNRFAIWDGDTGALLKVGDKTESDFSATGVGLGNVTNHAQVQKIGSSTNNRLAVWDGVNGNLLKVGDKTEADMLSLAVANTWTKAQTSSLVTLTDGATISFDASTGNAFRVTLGGSRALANPTNAVSGWTFNLKIKQDGTGSRTLSFGNKYAFPAGAAQTLTTTANAVDILTGFYDSNDDLFHCILSKDSRVPA